MQPHAHKGLVAPAPAAAPTGPAASIHETVDQWEARQHARAARWSFAYRAPGSGPGFTTAVFDALAEARAYAQAIARPGCLYAITPEGLTVFHSAVIPGRGAA